MTPEWVSYFSDIIARLASRLQTLEAAERIELAGLATLATTATTATTALAVPTATVAGLPVAGTAGRLYFATNGRKVGEGAGAGTGVLCYDDGVAWRTCDTSTTVAA